MSTKESETRAIAIPGGRTHHHIEREPEISACWNMFPQDTTEGSPRPRNSRADSVRIAAGTVSAKLT